LDVTAETLDQPLTPELPPIVELNPDSYGSFKSPFRFPKETKVLVIFL
jgi:hypothetical protein